MEFLSLSRRHSSLGQGSAVGEKDKKWSETRKYWRAKRKGWSGKEERAADPGDRLLKPPFRDTKLILVSCSDWSNILMLTDSRCCCSIAILQNYAPSIREMTFITRQQAIQISVRHFSLIPRLEKMQKIWLWSIAKRKEAFKILSFSYSTVTF